MYRVVLLLAASTRATAAAGALNASITNGVLSITDAFVGKTTSAINNVIAKYFAGAGGRPAGDVSLRNSSSGVYSYLTLTGAYNADGVVNLTSQLVLVLADAHFTVLPTLKPGGAALQSA